MSNIYVFSGESTYFMEEECNKLIKQKDIADFNITKYNFLDSEPLDILNELRTVSFFSEEKMVIISNPEFLKKTYNNQAVINAYKDYFLHENSMSCLVILVDFPLDKNLDVVSVLLDNCNLKQIENLSKDNLSDYIKNEFSRDGFQIDLMAIEELINRTEANIWTISNEISKIQLYGEKNITKEIITLLVSKKIDDDIYELINAYLQRQSNKVIELYRNLISTNNDEMRILSAFQAKLEEIYYTKALLSQGLSKDQIASYFRIKPGRAYYMILNAKNVSNNSLVELIDRSLKVESDIKSGKIDKKIGIELFILGV